MEKASPTAVHRDPRDRYSALTALQKAFPPRSVYFPCVVLQTIKPEQWTSPLSYLTSPSLLQVQSGHRALCAQLYQQCLSNAQPTSAILKCFWAPGLCRFRITLQSALMLLHCYSLSAPGRTPTRPLFVSTLCSALNLSFDKCIYRQICLFFFFELGILLSAKS